MVPPVTHAVELSQYTPGHRAELEALLATPEWRRVIDAGLVDEVRGNRTKPGTTIDYIDTVVDQLAAFNEPAVREQIARGQRDRTRLLAQLGTWPDRLEGRNPTLSFLGLTVTYDCNFDPRCVYCNQEWRDATVGLDGWKRLVDEATEHNGGSGPYIYITGGEPLNLEDAIWGCDGLVAHASRRGAAVNVNTNALKVTPEIALRLIQCGTSKLHISLDTPVRSVQDYLWGGERQGRVLEGIYHLQLARELVGVTHPEIHTNCVLSKLSLDTFPQLFALLLDKRKQLSDRQHPLFQDLFPHVIPVGGDSNADLRPTAEEFRRFYDEIWPRVCDQWSEYQGTLGVPEGDRGVLFGYFSNPFLRVEHEGGLDAYVESSAAGRYGELALSQHCYVAPTQASVSPDGAQFRCGSHAVRRDLATGNAGTGHLIDNIRAGVDGLDQLPNPDQCYGCALATLYINQSVERKLEEKIDELIEAA